ncbi:MAG: hypothetical protein KGJ86_21140 [Chloroflexota bacterium]|nr:hypothetical protein [Chloroflexota bacterium]
MIIPHPVGQLPRETARAIADQALEEIIDAVTHPRERLANVYRGRVGRPGGGS